MRGIDIMEDFDRLFKKEASMEKRCKKVSRSLGIVMLFWTINLFAQGPDTLWTRTYGGVMDDAGWSVQQTSDGGYIVTGATKSFGTGKRDVYLIKTDAKGDTLWTKIYGGAEDDLGYSVQQTSDGGYIIAGYTYSFNWGVYLIKTDANGDTLWTKTYRGINWARGVDNAVQQTSDEGYIIIGETFWIGAGSLDVYLIKTDTRGDILWTRTYGGTEDDWGYSVQQISDGGYIIVGFTEGDGAGGKGLGALDIDVYFIKTDAMGDTLWTKTYGGSDWDFGYSVQETSDGGAIIVGHTYSFGAGNGDVYLIKTKPDPADIKESFQEAFLIFECEPNPFSERTTIRYTIHDAGYKPQDFSLMIYDISGRDVRDLTNKLASCIRNHVSTVSWDGRDNAGEKVSSGVYFLRFEAGEHKATRKLLIIR